MSNVIKGNFFTRKDINAVEMLGAIAEKEPENVFVICWPKDGTMPTYHSSTPDMPIILMRIQEFIHKFYNEDFK